MTDILKGKNSSIFQNILLLAYPFAAVAYFFLIDGTLPSIMQDELVYLNSTKGELTEADYPNYFYFWLYSSIVGSGGDFYSATKLLNLAFHTSTSLVIFVFFRQRFSFIASFLAGLCYLASGFVIFTSFFMPEAVYAFLVVSALLLFWSYWENGDEHIWLLVLSATLIGVAQLTKPHGIFIFALVMAWILLGPKVKERSRLKAVLLFVAGFSATRIVLGFILVGASSLDFFGSYIPDDENPGSRLSETLADPLFFVGQLVLNSIQHLIFLSFVLVVGAAYFIARKAQPSKFFFFTLWVIVGLSIFIAAFESYITIDGDDHSARLLARHYEFLIPIVLLSIVYSSDARNQPEKRTSFTAALSLFGLGVAFVALSLLEGLVWSASGYSDSGITTALRTTVGTWFFVLVGLAAIGYLSRKSITLTGYLSFSALLLMVPAIVTTTIHIQDNSQPLPSDRSAYYVAENHEDVPGERILVLGSDKALTEASVFLMNKTADFRVLTDRRLIDPDDGLFEYDLVVQHTGISLSGVEEATYYGDGFAVTDVRQLEPGSFGTE